MLNERTTETRHEPRQRPVITCVLGELDEVPIIPSRRRHGLVSVIENRLGKWKLVPLETSHLASLAPDAGSGVDQFADLLLPPCPAKTHSKSYASSRASDLRRVAWSVLGMA